MSSWTRPSSAETSPKSLEDLLADCLRQMEQGKALPREAILDRYPQWAGELREFFENWDEMETFSSRLVDSPWKPTNVTASDASGLPARFVGDYELLEEIGRGGMGIIYKARQRSLDRLVAVKMISDRRHDRERFRLEAELAASLEHPNIVSIIEVGEWEEQPYFSMQYVDGIHLGQRIADGPLSPRQAAELTAKLAEAVHYAHQRGILHRDLKPANVLLDSRGEPFVTDFGLAKQIRPSGMEAEMTVSGAILGTPGYMSPEQAEGRAARVTLATDVYGLGAVLYTILTGCAPFESDSSVELLRMVVEQPPKTPRSLRPEIPRDLETICLKCLEKAPSSRYASAEALRDDLLRFLRHEPIEARPVGWAGRVIRWGRRNPSIAVSVGVMLVSLTVTSIFFSMMARREHQARLTAEAGRKREQNLRMAMDRSMKSEQSARRQAVATLVDSFTANGLQAHDQEDPNLALLWFLEAWNHAEPASSARKKNTLRVSSWEKHLPRPVAAWHLPNAKWSRLAFDASGRYLLMQEPNRAFLWDTSEDQQWDLLRDPGAVTMEWHPSEPWMLCSRSGELCALAIPSCEEKWKRPFSDVATQLLFSRNGQHAAVVHGNSISIWNDSRTIQMADPQVLTHPSKVLHAAIAPEGERLIAACDDGLVRNWVLADHVWTQQTESIPFLTRTRNDGQLIVLPTFFADGHLIVGRESKYKNRWDHVRVDFYRLATHQHVGGRIIGDSRYFAISPHGDRFVNLGDQYGRIWDSTKGAHADRLAFRSDVTLARFSSDSQWLAAGGSDQQVQIWHSAANPFPDELLNSTRTCEFVLPHAHTVVGLEWANERRLATASADGLVRVWELPTDDRLRLLPLEDGKSSATRADEKETTRETTDVLLQRITSASDRIAAANVEVARLSPDNKRIVLAYRDGTVRIASWPDGELNPVQMVLPGTIVDALFSADGAWVITASSDAKLRIWDAETGRMLGFPITLPWHVTAIECAETGDRLLLQLSNGRLAEVKLSEWRMDRSLTSHDAAWAEQLQASAELVSGRRMEAGRVRQLSTQEWMQRWRTHRQQSNVHDR